LPHLLSLELKITEMPQQKSREAESLRGLSYCKKLPNFYIYVHTLFIGSQVLRRGGGFPDHHPPVAEL
jgi:hypothetical protein